MLVAAMLLISSMITLLIRGVGSNYPIYYNIKDVMLYLTSGIL